MPTSFYWGLVYRRSKVNIVCLSLVPFPGKQTRNETTPVTLSTVKSMGVRVTAFPIVFCGALVVFTVGFCNRRKLFPEVDEINRRKAEESRVQAVAFKSQVAAGVKREREQRREVTE